MSVTYLSIEALLAAAYKQDFSIAKIEQCASESGLLIPTVTEILSAYDKFDYFTTAHGVCHAHH